MEEEEIYINLFDRYNRNEIDHADMVDSFEEMDLESDVNSELHDYQVAIMTLEQGYLRGIINDIEEEFKPKNQSAGNGFRGVTMML